MASILGITVLSIALIKLAKLALDRRNSPIAELGGPPGKSFLLGTLQDSFPTEDRVPLFEEWAKEYGSVYKIPTGFGSHSVVLCDPKAIAHIHAKDGYTYLRLPFSNGLMNAIIGPSMLSADKDDHRRLRRSVVPAFSNAALRGVTNVFYDSAYKVKLNWDALFESCTNETDGVTIDVQEWMNKFTFDSIGIAGFGHDFKSLEGHKSPVFEAFSLFKTLHDSIAFLALAVVAFIFPQVFKLPSKPGRILNQMKTSLSQVATDLLEDSKREEGTSEATKDRSIIGVLLKDQRSDGKVQMSHDELVGQGLFLLAGYETTAVSLSWALIELARNPGVQERLREESVQLSGGDPSWEQLMSGLPYLDAVVHEVLRFHPPAEALTRVAGEDDTIPLSSPVKLASGRTVESISIPKGTNLISSNVYANCCEAFWGPHASKFDPERWMRENPYRPKELIGHRQLYTFSDGPRMCLGKTFAIAELKAALCVLIRSFAFELPEGPNTRLGIYRSIFPRPKVAGELGCVLPMRVKQVTFES